MSTSDYDRSFNAIRAQMNPDTPSRWVLVVYNPSRVVVGTKEFDSYRELDSYIVAHMPARRMSCTLLDNGDAEFLLDGRFLVCRAEYGGEA